MLCGTRQDVGIVNGQIGAFGAVRRNGMGGVSENAYIIVAIVVAGTSHGRHGNPNVVNIVLKWIGSMFHDHSLPGHRPNLVLLGVLTNQYRLPWPS